jgi:histidine ammonia-lyase
MAIQLNLFATGRSGVRLELAEAMVKRLNASSVPAIRIGSSVGASDIVALSQLALPLVEDVASDERLPGGLAPKEALSLMNSNALTLAQIALVLEEVGQIITALDMAAALSLEGLRGNPSAWSEAVELAHPQPGQVAAGRHLRALLAGSRLFEPGQPRFLQDPLSFRCVPQIHGATRAAFAWARGIVQTELNAAVDNPTVDLETSAIVSHGNMDTTLLALALDTMRLGLAKALQASGERVNKVQWPSFSGLPTGLAEEPGAIGGVQFLNLAHIAAAKIATASIAASPTGIHYHGQLCDGVEDVGGLAPHAVEATERLLGAAWTVATVEVTVACWAILRRNLALDSIGAGLQEIFAEASKLLPRGREGERPFDLAPLENLIHRHVERHAHATAWDSVGHSTSASTGT